MAPDIQNRAEKINQALFEISQAVNSTKTLKDTYAAIHCSLAKVLNVKNFYIAMYDESDEVVHIPYFVDEKEQGYDDEELTTSDRSGDYAMKLNKGSMTAMVIKSGEPLLITREELFEHCERENCKPLGPPPEIWLGAPLKIKNHVIGVIVVQSYDDPIAFDEHDAKVLNSVCDQVAISIERKIIEKSLKDSETRYRNLVENRNEILYVADENGAFTYINAVAERLLGIVTKAFSSNLEWHRFFIKGKSKLSKEMLFSEIIHPDDQQSVVESLEAALETETMFQAEYRIKTVSGKYRWVLEQGKFLRASMGALNLEGIIIDIHNRKRAELINRVHFEISDAVNQTHDLPDLYQTIYHSLNRVIDARNFYIAIYDKTKDSLTFPFDIDEMGNDEISEIQNLSESPSLTGEIIRTGEPVLLNRKEAEELVKQWGSDFIGDPPELWMGVPLKLRDEVIGAMVAQSYSDPNLFDEKDVKTFMAVSGHVAVAIERKRYEEQLLKKELELRTLFEISHAINTTFNNEQLYQSIHQILKGVIDVSNFAIALYEKESDRIVYPYLIDEFHPDESLIIEEASRSCSMAYEVIKKGQSLMLGRNEMDEFIKNKGGKLIGHPAESWLGLPLKGQSGNLGAIIIQNYQEPNKFKRKELELLESVSGQIAFAIERKQAESELASTQRELIEYAHKVGMADIANATLHNIGNILNNVKTSAEQIQLVNTAASAKDFKLANQLMKSKMEELEPLIEDKKTIGKLIDYYEKIESNYDYEKSEIHEQIGRLNKKIDLMTDVIKTQQTFTSARFMSGDYSLEEIIDDVLTMQKETLNRYKIKVNKICDRVPAVQVQRTKLVHILFNLVINSRDALKEIQPNQRKIDIILKRIEGQVELRVADTGIGISKENLTKIFTHGFTTKKNGHGFGLHNSAIYLAEMNGSIKAESEGPGKGAIFTISLPINLKPSNGINGFKATRSC